jgi:hypothetical protein
MADLVGAFAASHGPIIARDWETMPLGHRNRLAASFDEIGRRLAACSADLLVVISPDHWVNFFISNLPAVCIGIGDEHDGPPEPFMKKVFRASASRATRRSAPPARNCARRRFRARAVAPAQPRPRHLHPALAHRRRSGMPIVPIIVNDLEEPMPSIRRCLAWGRLLRRAIESYPEPLRIAVLGTGG